MEWVKPIIFCYFGGSMSSNLTGAKNAQIFSVCGSSLIMCGVHI